TAACSIESSRSLTRKLKKCFDRVLTHAAPNQFAGLATTYLAKTYRSSTARERSRCGYIQRPVRPADLMACFCAGLLLFGSLPAPAHAQAVASCQTTKAPVLYPQISDNTPGWQPIPGLTINKQHFVLGDIDGDGNDELVTLPPANGSNGF